MNILTKRSAALGALALSMAAPAVAQNLRPERTFYLMPRLGFSSYYGDHDNDLFDFTDWKQEGKFPYSAALELGYQFTPGVALGLSYQIADYPTIFGEQTDGNNPGRQDSEDEYTRRHEGFATLRFTAGARTMRVAPFLELGVGGIAGTGDPVNSDDTRYSAGVRAGLGLDIVLSRRTSLFLGAYTNAVLDDAVADASDQTVVDPGQKFTDTFLSDVDFLSHVGLGLKINFKPAFTPVDVIAIDGPTALQTGQTGNYTATTNDGLATAPVSYMWDFGDGATAEGLSASHAYSTAGTYRVTFTASNEGSTDMAEMQTVVTNPPVPAELLSLGSTPAANAVCINQAVRFTTTGRGDAPVSYTWNFGDGGTGTGSAPTYTYTRPGTYTATVTASNASGSNSRTATVVARDCTPVTPVACSISELNSTYFDRNSSTITEQGRMRLMENVDALRRCDAYRTNIVGYASRGERDPQGLSEARARSVMQFYVDNGIAASRLTMEGRGMMGGSKKDDVNQYRRVDSMPMR